jgi:copper(I)-binding protein
MNLSLMAVLLAASLVSVPEPPGLPSLAISVHGETIYQTAKAGDPTQGFLQITNTGPADTLTQADCPIADFTSIVGADGQKLASVAVPAAGSLGLVPGGPHLLLQSTHFSVQYGGLIPCSLTFANAGTVSIFLEATPAP